MQEHWTDRAKAEMKARQMSVPALAAAIGENEDKVKAWFREKTDNPRGDAMEKVAALFGKPVEWLRYGRPVSAMDLTQEERKLIEALRRAPSEERPELVKWFDRVCRSAALMAAIEDR